MNLKEGDEDKTILLNDDKVNLNHRVLRLSLEEDTKDEIDRSLIAYSRMVISVPKLVKMMEKDNIRDIKVQRLEKQKFLLTFGSSKIKNEMDLGWLDPWLASFHEVQHKDLILPRIAWLKCDGLPLSLWNQSIWEIIAKEWGSFSHIEPLDSSESYLSTPLICVHTHQVKKINETFKVYLDKVGFWVIVKEVSTHQSLAFNHKPTVNTQDTGGVPEGSTNVMGIPSLEKKL